MEIFLVLHLTGSTYHNLSVLQGPVLLLKIFTYVTEQSQKNSLNKDTGITNFAKPSPNSIIEIFLSSVNTNVIWKLSCDRVFLIRNFMVTWFTNFVRSCIFWNLFYKRIKSFLKKIMIQLYCNALHVWLSIPLQSIAKSFYLVIRWQTGVCTTWWFTFKALTGRGMSDLCTISSLSYSEHPSFMDRA